MMVWKKTSLKLKHLLRRTTLLLTFINWATATEAIYEPIDIWSIFLGMESYKAGLEYVGFFCSKRTIESDRMGRKNVNGDCKISDKIITWVAADG